MPDEITLDYACYFHVYLRMNQLIEKKYFFMYILMKYIIVICYFIGLDAEGNKKMMEGSGLIARIIQHEIDHLNGILYTDKMIPKSLTCTVWREINELNGLIELRYYPRVRV